MSHFSHRRRAHRGQSLVLFALIAMVLLGVVGLGVDGGFSYFASDRLERGAMAAALAGVPDMPNFNSSPNDATSTAVAAAAKNGWTAGGANNVAISVAKVADPNNAGLTLNNRLQVTITSDVPVFFMKLLGFGSHREARTAIAEYLRPITFGQPGNALGSDQTNLGSGSNFYFMRSEGWGTPRNEGDAYGPNPSNTWTTFPSAPNTDVHALSGTQGTETASQPLATMPARGGQNYQVYVPAGQTTTLQVYNPVFAPDNSRVGSNANGYNYHEDDSFPETVIPPAAAGACPNAETRCGPSNAQQWPIMSYTVYKSANPFDHGGDVWLTNLRVLSIDATTSGLYTIPGFLPASGSTTQRALSGISNPKGVTTAYYHDWVNIQDTPTGAATKLLPSGGFTTNGSQTDILSGGATGTTYRLRVDQLDSLSNDPGQNGLAQNQNSQAHKGYAVQASGCATCTVTALDDITLFTPIKAGTFTMPLVSIPPEYAGHTFGLYIFDPGDVTCNSSGCSNVLTVTQPTNSGASQAPAQTFDGVFAGQSGEGSPAQPATWTNKVAAGDATIQTLTQDYTVTPTNLYNGTWLRFDISIPSDYASGATPDVNSADPKTWFWNLSYTTSQAAADTITANLGATGAPVHLISG